MPGVRRQGAPTSHSGFYGEEVQRRRRTSGTCIAAENLFVMGIRDEDGAWRARMLGDAEVLSVCCPEFEAELSVTTLYEDVRLAE